MERTNDPEPILKRTRSFIFARSRDDATGRGLLRVSARDPSSPTQRARLRSAASAHRSIAHPHVAPLFDHDLDGATPWLRFDLAALTDGDDIVSRIAARHEPLPFDAATGLIEAYAEALIAAHATPHPETGAPCCLGVVGWPCFFFDAQGSFAIVGFGAPLALDAVPLAPGAYVAPDVLTGAAPSPGADVLAFTLMQRSSLSLVALPEALARVFSSTPGPEDLRLATATAAANFRLFVGAASKRPAAAEMLALLRRTWRRLGVTPDLARYQSIVRSLLGTASPTRLRVASDAAWFEFGDSGRVSLARRAPLRRVLAALVGAASSASSTVDVPSLINAGWPGEKMRADSGAGRVYVALSTLRRMGLSDAIERFDDGYRIRPDVIVERG